MRGHLGPHAQRRIITTSDFSPDTRNEAVRPHAASVDLVSSQRRVNSLLEHESKVRKSSFELFEWNWVAVLRVKLSCLEPAGVERLAAP